MRTPSSSKALALVCLLSWAGTAQAQAPASPASSPPVAESAAIPSGADPPGDTLLDALTCRTSVADIASLLPRLRRERPDEFVQTERQYSSPMMDLYRLVEPVRAWGHESDAVVVTPNRVLLAVEGPLEQAAAQLEHELQRTQDAPLSGALDEQHALLVYAGDRPGLDTRTLIGCEYRIPDLSLLDDPQDAWRKSTP
ncbi:hypothetical protein [Pseudoxanthomonas putridarboris]|uniref:Uncharacterized protein n=1 Tax=Pseudoxanthomonas putridarboris TaxID=752605 RepID=A0ABU9J042_9GAMM